MIVNYSHQNNIIVQSTELMTDYSFKSKQKLQNFHLEGPNKKFYIF